MGGVEYWKRTLDLPQLLERLSIRFDRRGTLLWARCPHPDHSERTPSWRMINEPGEPKHGQHRCYGCGQGGWTVHLVEWALGCTRQQANEWLRDIKNNPPPLPFGVKVEFGSAGRKFQLPQGVVQAPLEDWLEEPRDYLLSRGVARWQVGRWKLGYAPRNWHPDKNPLAGRIVIPVYGAKGQLLSYTGRTYVGAERRYKEPSKREGADLGAVFGEQYWQGERNIVVVTEGALDALAVERLGGYHLAGLFGSQLHESHVAKLSTFEKVLVASDPDGAGNKMVRELMGQLGRWVRLGRVELPAGEDCASAAPGVLDQALKRARSAL